MPHSKKNNQRILIFSVVLIFLWVPTTHAADSLDIDLISTAVVQVVTPVSAGSGMIYFLGNDAVVITNRHVVEGFKRFIINILYDVNDTAKPGYYADLIGYSTAYDVAFLKITQDLNQSPVSANEVKSGLAGSHGRIFELEFAEMSYVPRRGEEIALLGFPGIGENQLVYSRGIIATVTSDELYGKQVPVWLRTDAGMSPGSSGGIAINENGYVIGMPTYIRLEQRTGGRLGSILSSQVIQTVLTNSDELSDTWDTSGIEAGLAASILDYRNDPNFGEISLSAGFIPDPRVIEIVSGGEVNINDLNLEQDCIGFTSTAPDLRLFWTGRAEKLLLYFNAINRTDDATMIVNLPDGTWMCNDDAHPQTFNPLVRITKPEIGQYDIWIGSFIKGEFIRGEILITEQEKNVP